MRTLILIVRRSALLLTLIVGFSAFANAQSKTPVKTSDLQKSITNYISSDYAGYTIKNAYKVDRNKQITYDVNVMKDNKITCLAFDNSGKFIKVMEKKNKTNKTNTGTTAMIHKGKTKQALK